MDDNQFKTTLRKTLKLYQIEPITTELVVYGKLSAIPGLFKEYGVFEYSGQIDLVANVLGERSVIDLKTGRAIVPGHALQVAAYAHALDVKKGYVLHLTDAHSVGELIEIDLPRATQALRHMFTVNAIMEDPTLFLDPI